MNTKLRAYLVDDEPLALDRLRRLLAHSDQIEVVGWTSIPEEAVATLTAHPPDLCFLDIQMPRLDGFAVLARLPRQPAVIFTTAHAEFALQAFGVNSIDYLLKPVDRDALERAIQKVLRLRQADTGALPDVARVLEQIEASLRRTPPDYPERIASRVGNRIWFLELAEVMHFQALDKLTFAVTEAKSYGVDHTIAELETMLDPRKFLRIHRGTVVNLDWIKEVVPLPGGGLKLRLGDAKGSDLAVARDRAREFRQRIGC